MADLFIKNKRRIISDKAVVKKPYTPEHRRLNVSPIEYPVKDPEDLERSIRNTKMEKLKKERDQDLISLVKKYRDGEISKEELQSYLGIDVLDDVVVEKKRALVSSGQNEEHLWTNIYEDKPISKKVVYDEEISVDEVQEPPAKQALEDDEDDDAEEFSLSDLNINQYVIVHNDNLLCIGDKNKIIKTLVELIENSEEVDINDFIILKRVSLKYGISIEE